ncbi:MAG: YggS family pyridoxal phosphate-dependent enzyme [Clostridiaceae bacterium]|jgi:pyridoxal phosphate enzyme (YggS family)|nr:YggS family pyridoxal phosphate-dependent enzyme [Clostridiaceae bacterium]
MNIERNIEELRERIAKSAAKSGRKPEDIHVVAVCKTVGVDEVIRAYKAGMVDFGENRAQDFLKKYENLAEYDLNWHFIGHLQRNKVKYIVDKVKLIHSVDSIRLAKEIDNQARKINKVVDCLLQLNVSGEEQKYGLDPDMTYEFLEEVSKMEHIRIKGLMTMAPYDCPEKELRKIFSRTHEIYVDISKNSMHNINMDYLSMGMSNDFEIAIEEGANMIRVGSSIFH